ncbi:MAG: HlyD family secretion protein [Gemmataceae bacterium]
MLRTYGLPALALTALLFAVYHVVTANQPKPKLPPPAPPARTPYGKGLSAAGLVEPETQNVSVGSHLPGVVTAVRVKVGDEVTTGQPLFELDDRQLAAELAVREAALKAARSQLAKLEAMPRPEEVPPLEARLSEARASLVEKADQLSRLRRLFVGRAASEEDRVRAEQAAQMAREQVKRAEADLQLLRRGAWTPDRDIAAAAVAQQEAMAGQARTELARLKVKAPELRHRALEVLQVNVRPGEFVNAAGGSALVVLGSTKQLHVRADLDEHDIHRFSPRAAARAMLRGDPSQEYPLTFVRVEPYVVPKRSLTGDNTERVDTRVLQVIYAVGSGPSRLYVGQQLDVYIEGAVKGE